MGSARGASARERGAGAGGVRAAGHQVTGRHVTQQKTIDERRPSPSPWRSQKCAQSAHGHAASGPVGSPTTGASPRARAQARARLRPRRILSRIPAGPAKARGPGGLRKRDAAKVSERQPPSFLGLTQRASHHVTPHAQLCNHHAPPAGAPRRAARRGARPAPSAAAGVPARARRVRGRQDARGVDRPHGHRPLELPHQGGAVDRVRPAHAAAARQRDGGRGGVRRRARPGGGRGHRRHPRPAAGRRLDAAAAGQRRAVHRPRHRVRRPAGAERVARDVPARRALRRPVRRRGAPERPLPRLRPDGDLVRAASGYPAARAHDGRPTSLPSACAGCCRR